MADAVLSFILSIWPLNFSNKIIYQSIIASKLTFHKPIYVQKIINHLLYIALLIPSKLSMSDHNYSCPIM